jgi:acyl-CoA synthetase (AMP-forming)/AMP-acid ligase II
MLDAARVKLILTDVSLVKNLTPLAAAARQNPALCAVTGLSENADTGDRSADAEDFGYGDPDELALIQFSSGTTVAPKPVALSHRNILSNTRAIIASFPGDLKNHSGCSWLPLHHDMGLIGGLFTAVAATGDITFLRPEDFIARPAAWLKAMSVSKATVCPAPNFALQICVDRISDNDLAGLDLSHWQIALIGAETVREPTLRRFYERFASCGFRYESFTPVYGLAEATLAVTFSDPLTVPRGLRIEREALAQGQVRVCDSDDDEFAVGVVSVGRPLNDVAIELRDRSGAVLGEDRVGRIYIRGPLVMTGYYKRPDATAAAIQNGWLDTGDLGFAHDGDIYIYGRERDIIILNGRNHDPQTIEFALDRVPGLDHDRAAAVAIDDPARGTESFAVLVEKEKGQIQDAPELARAAREAIIGATGLIPDVVLILPTGRLPRTTSGKVKRGVSRARLVAGELEILAESRR